MNPLFSKNVAKTLQIIFSQKIFDAIFKHDIAKAKKCIHFKHPKNNTIMLAMFISIFVSLKKITAY